MRCGDDIRGACARRRFEHRETGLPAIGAVIHAPEDMTVNIDHFLKYRRGAPPHLAPADLRIAATSACLLSSAKARAVLPSSSCLLSSAFARRSAWTDAILPRSAATISAVIPAGPRASTLAPPATSASTTLA